MGIGPRRNIAQCVRTNRQELANPPKVGMNTVPSSDEGLIKIIRHPEEAEAID